MKILIAGYFGNDNTTLNTKLVEIGLYLSPPKMTCFSLVFESEGCINNYQNSKSKTEHAACQLLKQ